MYSIYKSFRFLSLFAFHISDKLCDSPVSKKHELLNEFVGIFRLFEIYSCRMTVLIYVKSHLCAVKINRAVLKAPFTQNFGKAIKCQHFFFVIALPCLNDILSLLISEPAVAFCHCTPDLGIYDLSARSHLKDA